jgi:glycosyltransferase involved in cell wall biosynthesis
MPVLADERTPLVSVVMPVCDPHPVWFRQAVDSILRQTMPDLELLIVEDPSPHSAAALLADVSDPRLRHLLRPARGTLVESLNEGLTRARAGLIARADADDVCEPDRLEKQLAFLEQHADVDILGSRVAVIDGAGTIQGYRYYPLEHESIVRGLSRSNTLAHPSVLFKKDRILAAGGYRPFFNEDYELWSRLAKQQARFANHPEPLVRYRVVRAGIRSAKVRNALRGTLEVKRMYWVETMDLAGRLRMWAERMLLLLPPQLVVALFLRMQVSSYEPEA